MTSTNQADVPQACLASSRPVEKVSEMSTVNLVASLFAPPEAAERVSELLLKYARHVTMMEGVERFEVYADRDDPGNLMVLERYRDTAAFDAHLADPENTALNDKLRNLTPAGSVLTFLTPLQQR
jgi:quinol monooxygenase YgiN